MSNQRNGITDEEVSELIFKLQSLLTETRQRGPSRSYASKILKETCSYIKSLHKEVDDLSERLASLLTNMEGGSSEAEIVRNLLRSN